MLKLTSSREDIAGATGVCNAEITLLGGNPAAPLVAEANVNLQRQLRRISHVQRKYDAG
jgi:hypothetical protein